MTVLPSPKLVAGNHYALYDAYWKQVDPNSTGVVGAIAAARFLKKSGLSDVVLSRIWDLADPAGRGCLDMTGFFVALKLVAITQVGKDLSMNNIMADTPPPKMGDMPKIPSGPPPKPNPPLIASMSPALEDWSIKPSERDKYDQLFNSLQPDNGMLPGNKVKGVLMESKLPLDTLGKIWDLADIDKDGMLDRHEFVVAMHLVYKALEKHTIPTKLPTELLPPGKKIGGPPAIPPMPVKMPPQKPAPPVQSKLLIDTAPSSVSSQWVVSADEKSRYDAMFVRADVDRDGFVSGLEIKDVFLQSGVPQATLAKIWNLCDTKQTGKLNSEQFALAMWFVNRQLQGIEPPNVLEPFMLPPSMRNGGQAPAPVKPLYSNPELDMISKEIEELAKEKLLLETDITQKEADIKIKNSEIKSLENEHDTLVAAFKQLENQKGEAQKRLNDLKSQVDKLRSQATEQEATLKKQESDVNQKREILETLRHEQTELEGKREKFTQQLDQIGSKLASQQLKINSARAAITQLQEQQRQMSDVINICNSVIETNDLSLCPDSCLQMNPGFRDIECNLTSPTQRQNLQNNNTNNFNDPFANNNGNVTSHYNRDGFQNDNFTNHDAFGADPFGSNSTKGPDPFDPFGDKNRNASVSPNVDAQKDAFGCDPFAILHAPTRDGTTPGRTSPSPALPPKKGKTPPPRPAPPKAMSSVTPSDPFGGAATNDGFGFANFADFDKFSPPSAPFVNSTTSLNQTNTTQPEPLTNEEDPFKNYRYEDVFNICDDPFSDDDDDRKNANVPPTWEKTAWEQGAVKSLSAANFTDIFADFDNELEPPATVVKENGRASVPLPQRNFTTLPASKVHAFGNNFADNFRNNNPERPVSAIDKHSFFGDVTSEEEELAWAAKESLAEEEERQRKIAERESNDLKLALRLSTLKTKGK